MLFNSYIFIFLFLPVTITGFYLIGGRGHHRIAISWLVGASLFFYGWWNPAYLGLMLGSILFNYAVGVSLGNSVKNGRKGILALGVVANISLLGYFKYANFFVDNINRAFGSEFHLETIILPLAISFFTFQQVAYLVDAYKGETREYNFLHYCLFVTFFPQLIAGPIVHHKEMLPQFAKDIIYRLNHENISVGITIFTIGLFKKVVLADGVAAFATPVFSAAEQGIELTFLEAWGGSLAYTLQLYFDFSGYSDMAIGLARMFGILLPLNFHSPYKAKNIIEFWRHWHMTLSRFLRDYLYIPLGGSRKGKVRRYTNLMVTMLLGGLWHGADWTFVLWGTLHGLYLMINHAWQKIFPNRNKTKLRNFFAWSITMLAVVVAWVPFRAESIIGASNLLSSMFGLNGISLPASLVNILGVDIQRFTEYGIVFDDMFFNKVMGEDPMLSIIWIGVLLIIATLFPNTQQFLVRYQPVLYTEQKLLAPYGGANYQWTMTYLWAMIFGVIFAYLVFRLSNISEFLYFQF